VLYERGAFAAGNATPTVSAVLSIFGIGLPAFVLIRAFTPGYFAREDTRTPMYFAAASVVVNMATALVLFPRLGVPAIAIASAVAGWINAGLLFATLVRRGHWGGDRALISRIPRLVVASAIMAVALYFVAEILAPQLAASSPVAVQAGALAIVTGIGMTVYLAAALALGGADIGMIRQSLRRDGPDPSEPGA